MTQTHKTFLKYSMATPLFVGLLLISGTNGAMALPQDGTVVGGKATIKDNFWGTKTTVTQTDDRAIINWKGFDVGLLETVEFKQPGKTSVTLNRVTSGGPSKIDGTLKANGTVMIINSHGVVFGAFSSVNVAGLVATSSDIDNAKFMGGDYTFSKPGDADAEIINRGTITAVDGGLVAMAGPNVKNTGVINAKLGKVQMGSGDTFAIDLYGDGLIRLQASDKIKKQLVENTGDIYADGGSILMTAAAAQNAINSVINMDGLLQADNVAQKNGKVVLTAEAGQVNVGGDIKAHGDVTVEGKGVSVVGFGPLLPSHVSTGGGNLKIAASSGEVNVAHARLSTNGGNVDISSKKNDVAVSATSVDTAGGDVKIETTGDVALNDSSVNTAGGDLSVSGNNVTLWGFWNGGFATKGGNLTLTAKDYMSLRDVSLTADAGQVLLTSSMMGLANTAIGDKNTTGAIKFVTDNLALNDCPYCVLTDPTKIRTTSTVTFETLSTNKSIGVAGGVGDLQLTSDLLDGVKADTIVIGSTTKGTGVTAKAYTWKSNVEMLTQSGAVALNGLQNVGGKDFFGQAVTGDVKIGAKGGIKSTAEGTAVTLVAGGNFTNAGGASAISTKNGRWLIYSTDPNFDTMGGLVSDFHRYSCTFGGSCPSFPASGNGNLYSVTPYLTVLAKDTTITYGQSATYDYMIVGYRNGDKPLDTISLKDAGEPAVLYSTSYDTSYALSRHAGMYALNVISADNLLSSLGYGFKTDKTSPGMITVNKAALTVGIDDKNKTYGQLDPALTYNVSGLQYNDTKSVVGDLTRAPGENVIPGGYAINVAPGLVMQNYVIDPVTYKSGTLTIDKAALTVLIDDKSKTYGQVDPELTYQVSGLQFSDTKEDVIGSLVRAPGEHVVLGGYAIGVDPARMIQNYYINLETSKDGVLTINKASLTVQADNKSMTYQTSVPALTYSYDPTALKNGDTASVFTGGLTTTATNTSLPGVYAIIGDLLSAGGDYDLTVLPGQLTVTADTSGVSDVVAQGKASAALSRQPYTGVLLAMSTMPRGALGNLAPAAGGAQGAALTPAQLADLAPAAGGNGPAANGGVVSLIECGVDTPCQLNW